MTSKKVLTEIEDRAIEIIREKIPEGYYYHNDEHTLDVIGAAERIGSGEQVSEEDLNLLKIAAAYHDTGYVISRVNHEEQSCAIARKELLDRGIESKDIERICELILATKVPHHPKNKLEEILCDADLDYLGRDDYFKISTVVFKEFRFTGVINSEAEWMELQVKFLESHKYFTTTSIKSRKSKKEENLRRIKESVK